MTCNGHTTLQPATVADMTRCRLLERPLLVSIAVAVCGAAAAASSTPFFSEPPECNVTSLCWSQNGRYLLAGYAAAEKPASGRPERACTKDKDSGTADHNRIILWDVATGQQVCVCVCVALVVALYRLWRVLSSPCVEWWQWRASSAYLLGCFCCQAHLCVPCNTCRHNYVSPQVRVATSTCFPAVCIVCRCLLRAHPLLLASPTLTAL